MASCSMSIKNRPPWQIVSLIVSYHEFQIPISRFVQKGPQILSNELALLVGRPPHAVEGKSWNHPVVWNGRLYVRNGEEAACFDLQAQ